MKKSKQIIPWWRTNFGEVEINHVADSIRSEHLSQGPVTEEFEREIAAVIGIPYVTATTSGSIALLMALIAAGIRAGDEVIVPNRTWIATAHAPLLLGAKVVLVDVQSNCPIMDINQIEENITNKTKAIIPTHLNGRSVAMNELNKIAQKHGLIVIEDAAQAFCSVNKDGYLGSQSFAGCFSLSIAKLISTGQGGFIATRSEDVYKKLQLIRSHGVSDLINASYTYMGFNFRYTDILASIGIEQLKCVDERIKRVKSIYSRYASAIDDLSFMKIIPVNIELGEIPIYVEVLCNNRAKVINYLFDNGIQTRPFYPDLHTADYLKCTGNFPNSTKFGNKGLFLPCGPDQPIVNVDRVIEVLNSFKI